MAYDRRDYEILQQALQMATSIIWCPNVLTEVSNHLGHADDRNGRLITHTLCRLIAEWDERTIQSRVAATRPEFSRLGLTDAVLLHLAETGATLLTADLPLHLAALSANLPSVNFAELRDTRADFQLS